MWNDHPTAHERFNTEPIAWLTTVSDAGVPSTAPVWFYLENDGRITVYSRDPSVRARNLVGNPRVNLHLEGNGQGGAIVVVNGTAEIDKTGVPVSSHHAYLAKYQRYFERNGWTPEWFQRNYPTRISITGSSIRD